MITAHQVSQAVNVAAALGIADLLADGARSSDELAEATGSHPDALYRLLRALASIAVFREEEGRRFALAPLGEQLRTDAPESLAGLAVYHERPYYREAWSALRESVRTGENAFRLVHGTDVWEYRAARPDEGAIFDRAMAANTAMTNASILDAFDFGRFSTIVDVGGGNGTLLAAVLSRWPCVRGVLFDQPQVVAGARSLGERCEIVAGSFFGSVPDGGDAYVLKAIIHDWEDEEALAILRVVRRAGGTLLVIERALGGPNENPAAKFSDLNMLVAPGGRERTTDQYAALFDAAGFRLVAETPSASGWSVFEGAAA